jgi:hypothetical protein
MLWIPETPLIPTAGSGILLPSAFPRVLPRTDQVGDACPLLRSAPGFRTIPRPEWQEHIAAGSNNSSLVWTIFNQGSVGSCASESADQSVMLVREDMGLPRVKFNPYATYGRVNGGSDSGSTLSANLSFKRSRGCFPEAIWPRSKGWRATPSEQAYEAALLYRLDEFYEVTNWEEFGSALLQGWIVYWGYSGHAIVGVDVINEEQFLYLNSWGQWGQGSEYSDFNYGFGVVSRSRIMWSYGVYAFRQAYIYLGDEHCLQVAA